VGVLGRFRWFGRLLIVAAALTLAGTRTGTGVLTAAGGAQAAGSGPCDIYAAGGTSCVAAYSTVRALYSAYNGPLYQVRRVSDGATALSHHDSVRNL
jgi:non-reducing end alpha-L-arabinofuranosidase